MSTTTHVSPRNRSAARKRMKSTGEKYLPSLNRVIAERDARLSTPSKRIAHSSIPAVYYASLCTDEQWDRYPDARARFRRGDMDSREIDFLSRVCPGWEHSKLDRRWNVKANEAILFHAQHGRSARQEAADKDERRIGWWLTTQRRKSATSSDGRPLYLLSEWRTSYLDTQYPTWKDTHLSEETWSQRFWAAVEAKSQTGDLDALARKFLKKQKERTRFSVEELALFNTHFPDWKFGE